MPVDREYLKVVALMRKVIFKMFAHASQSEKQVTKVSSSDIQSPYFNTKQSWLLMTT